MENKSNVTVVDLTKEDAADEVDISIECICLTNEPVKRKRTETVTLDLCESPPPKISPSQRQKQKVPPKQVLSPPREGMKCPICIETCVNIKKRGEKIIVTKCGHIFCDSCIKRSFASSGNRKCPKCRKNVPRGNFIELFDVC